MADRRARRRANQGNEANFAPLPRITGSTAPPAEEMRPVYRVAAAEFRKRAAYSTMGNALTKAVAAVQAVSPALDDDAAWQIVADAVSYAATYHWDWMRG